MRFLYHGTSTGYLRQILRDGLRPESSYKGYLCYADDRRVATYHAVAMAEWDTDRLGAECRAIVFAIPVDRFAKAGFCLDENFIELGPSTGRAVGRDLLGKVWSWQRLLHHAGAVGYRERLRVDGRMIARIGRSGGIRTHDRSFPKRELLPG